MKYDLHCHTTHSDGLLPPKELIEQAKAVGLAGISITDHDTIGAYEELKEVTEIEWVPGVEFSSFYGQEPVHILGYSFSLHSQELQQFCAWHQERRKKRNKAILEKLRAAGMPLDEDELEAKGSVGRPHIAMLLQKKGYVNSVQEAFQRWLAEGRPCYAVELLATIEETIGVIHKAKGVACLAHPHLLKQPVELLLHLPFDGIEVYYAKYARGQCAKWEAIAKKKGWLMTGGSDFHRAPDHQLGSSYAPKESFEKLRLVYSASTSKAPKGD